MLLLSVHPRHVDAILAGTKRVELRRRCPRMTSGPALIYATAPRMELVASFRIEGVIRQSLDVLWQEVVDLAGVSRWEFDCYFRGLTVGVAIGIADLVELKPIALNELRAAWGGFHPPQGFRYLIQADFDKLTGHVGRQRESPIATGFCPAPVATGGTARTA